MPEKAKEKKVQKKKSMEKQERRLTKDFFDRIAPSTIRFYADHYIVGDSYRCAWAIREYPPSTDEQAIFSRIADKSGVTLRIYHRLVGPMEQRKIIQNAMRKNKLKSGGTDMTETVEAETEIGKYSGKFALTGKLICGECKSQYRRCTWSKRGTKKKVWRCINRVDYGARYCHHSPTIEENYSRKKRSSDRRYKSVNVM